MRCRIEELPFVAVYVRDNFVRDQADFIEDSAEYKENFLLKYDPQVKLVNEGVATALIIAQQKVLTERIATHYSTARGWVNKIENYAKKASAALVTNLSDFGFKTLRDDISNKNDEGVIKKFGDVLQIVDANKAALEVKGFTTEVRTKLDTFLKAFDTDIKNQSRKIDERKDLVTAHQKDYDALWEMINDVLETGKVIYKDKKDNKKVKDYTFSELIKKIRLNRKKEEDKTPAATDTKS